MILDDSDPWRGLRRALTQDASSSRGRPGPTSTGGGPSLAYDTKFRLPRIRLDTIHRRLLYKRMEAAPSKALTIVSSPPGFGKTTMTLGWLSQRPELERVAWLSLDEEDSDPAKFVTDLATSIAIAFPAFGTGVRTMAKSMRPVPPAALLQQLCADLRRLDCRLVIVIDDFHRGGVAVEAMVERLVDETACSVSVIVLTRTQPGLPLATWRARDDLIEIDREDLEFGSAEVRKFLLGTMRLKLTDACIDMLERKTEGWVAGLQMAALSMNRHARSPDTLDTDDVTSAFVGSHRFVVDYFSAWLETWKPSDLQVFLRRTSILRRMCAALCEAVTGESSSDHNLKVLDRANMFLVPLDDERRWYRYHGLFAEAFRCTMSADEACLLHLRACAWYERSGDGNEAFHHALETRDQESCVRIFRSHFETLVGGGETIVARRWLDALSADAVASRPDLAACKAWIHYLTGSSLAARPFAEIAVAGLGDCGDQMGWLLTFRAYYALNWGGPGDAAELAQNALRILPSTSRLFRVLALNYCGQGQAAKGLGFSAAATLLQSYTLAESYDLQGSALGALMHLALLMLRQGSLSEARRLAERAVARHSDMQGHPEPRVGVAAIALGAVALEANELPFAREMLESGMEVCERLELVYFGLYAKQFLARTLHASGDAIAAWRILTEARALADATGGNHRRAAIQATIAELQMKEGKWDAAGVTLARMISLAEPLMSDAQLILCARSKVEIGDIEAASGLLDKVEARAIVEGLSGIMIELQFVRGLIFEQRGDVRSAMACLNAAARFAGNAGYRRILADYIGAIRRISAIAEGPVDPVLVEAMSRDAALSKAEPSRRLEMRPALTAREVELLALLNLGLRNMEIADQLQVTVGTIKQYANQLYRKLGARNRIEAVLIARELQIHI